MEQNLVTLKETLAQGIHTLSLWAASPGFYGQLALLVAGLLIAYVATRLTNRRLLNFFDRQAEQSLAKAPWGKYLSQWQDLLFPLLLVILLTGMADVSEALVNQSYLIVLIQGFALIAFFYTLIRQFLSTGPIRAIFLWLLIPAAVLQAFGWLDPVTTYLDNLSVEAGNIKISVYGLLRIVLFGSILFWFGRLSRQVGQRVIRNQQTLDLGTREVFAKLFEVALGLVIFIVLLQVLGINLTTLAVFGGALAVGLGFGLQAIASNFISGIILLLDRSLTVGDYIELEDGRAGFIRELQLRSATIETFDGKDIMVPNEYFMTTAFTNWTHKNGKQRYSLEFQVAYSTDLEQLFPLIREVVAGHPSVISGDNVAIEEQPDAEIARFGESGIDILVEFWMEGIDDGINRVGGDLLLLIWYALRDNGIEIPFPQREVRLVGQQPANTQKN